MLQVTLALAIALLTFGSAQAGEIENSASLSSSQIQEATELAKNLPGTVVVRTHLTTGKVEALHVAGVINEGNQAEVIERASEFASVDSAVNELDTASSSSSWYFYFYNYRYYYPTYYYYGYSYRYYPYYYFNYGPYAYTYYRW